MGRDAMRVEWFPLGVGWMSERTHVCCRGLMFYNRGNSSKNNKTYLFGSLEDMLCCMLRRDISRDIVHITSRAQHSDVTCNITAGC